jgi:C1A family cysteine protease
MVRPFGAHAANFDIDFHVDSYYISDIIILGVYMRVLHFTLPIFAFLLVAGFLNVLPVQAQMGLPVRFDLRQMNGENYVTPVKSQSGGTCWTHGAWSAAEGNMLMTGAWAQAGEVGPPDLAEYHLDWWNGFNTFNNDDAPGTVEGLGIHYGGDYLVTAAYLSRGEGAVRDVDGQSFDVAPDRLQPGYHRYYAREILWLTMDDELNGIDRIKRAVMEHGVVGTAMCYSATFIQGTVHFQPPTDKTDPNHAVAIIGWDDEKITQAPLPGAWLIKNSWGSGWGENGFFWISYYDKTSCRHREMGAVSFRGVEPLSYDRIYAHDYHGWRATFQNADEAFNRFVADGAHRITALSFYTAADAVDYTATLYRHFNGTELTEPLATVSGTEELRGLHTVDLSTPIAVQSGDTFYVAVSLSEGGHAYDRTSSVDVLLGVLQGAATVPSVSHPGESLYRVNGTWFDLCEWEDVPWPAHTANFCIKALAVEGGTGAVDPLAAAIAPVLHQNYPNPFNPSTFIPFTLPHRMWCRVSVANMHGEIVAVPAEGEIEAGTYRAEFDASDLPAGVYVSTLLTERGSIMRKMVLVK